DRVQRTLAPGPRGIQQTRQAFPAGVPVGPGDRTLRASWQLAVHHPNNHLICLRAALTRPMVASRSTASRLSARSCAAPATRAAAVRAATSGAAKEVPLHTANPLRKLSGSRVRLRFGWWVPADRATAGVRLPLMSVGNVLTTAAPVAKQRTQGPSL